MGSRSGLALRALPGYKRMESAAEMGYLAVATLITALTPPYTWHREFVVQSSITIRRTFVPLLLSTIGYSAGLVVVYLGGVVQALGTLDRLGGGSNVAQVREISVWLNAMIIAGVAGSAMTADLAARKIRDELDALSVLGVDLRRTLVVPRIAAMTVLAPILGLLSVAIGIISAHFATQLLLGEYVTPAAFLETVKVFTNFQELVNMLIKLVLIGFIVGVVCCYKGLSSDGGAEGVGRAVNQAVLISFLCAWTINIANNVVFLALFPEAQVLRG